MVSCYVHVGGSGGIYFFLSFFLTLTLTTMDRVHRLPYGLVHGQPLQTPSRPLKTYIHSPSMGHPQNRIKIINRDFIHRLSNRITLVGKILNVTLCKCDRLGFRLRCKLYYRMYTMPFLFVVGIYERPGSLRESSIF